MKTHETLTAILTLLEDQFGAGDGSGTGGGIVWGDLAAAGQLAAGDGLLIRRGSTWYAGTVGDLPAGGGVDFSTLSDVGVFPSFEIVVNDGTTVGKATVQALAASLLTYYTQNKQVTETIAQARDDYGMSSGEGYAYFYGRNSSTNTVIPMGAFDFSYRGVTATTFLLWWQGQLRNVEVGAEDSAGAGFRTLRIPN